MIVGISSLQEVENKIRSSRVTELKNGSVLLFSKTSKFPRFKLESTTYKRCIKLNKANCVVCGDFDIKAYNNIHILEGEKNYYIMGEALPTYYAQRNSIQVREYADDWYKFLLKHPYLFEEGVTPKKLYESVSFCISKDANTLYNIMTDQITTTITDKALDKIVSGTLDELDEESFMSIKNMLESPDIETRGLGLRLLSGYNIDKVYTAIHALLSLNYYALRETNEWTTTAVKQFLKNFQLSYSVGVTFSCVKTCLERRPRSELDKKLCSVVLKEALKKVFWPTIKNANAAISSTGCYDFKIKIEFE